jgi:hypothetical protein
MQSHQREIAAIVSDLFNTTIKSDDADYTATMELLDCFHNDSLDMRIIITIYEGIMPTHMPRRKEYISPLMFALLTNRLDLALKIASQFPHYIDIPDARGDLPLINFIKCAHTINTTTMDDEKRKKHFATVEKLKRAFAHQVNIPNKNKVTPIFKTQKMQTFFTLYMMGAELDPAMIARKPPKPWRDNEEILAFLHYIGFKSAFLATTFNYYEDALLEASRRFAPKMHERMQAKATHMIGLPLSHALPALTMREELGRHSKRELHARAQFKKHNEPQSRKREQRSCDESTNTPQRQRTS